MSRGCSEAEAEMFSSKFTTQVIKILAACSRLSDPRWSYFVQGLVLA